MAGYPTSARRRESTLEQISLKLDLILEALEKIAYPDVYVAGKPIRGKSYESPPTRWDSHGE